MESMKKMRVKLDWFANTNHPGFFVALDKGYYRDAGLDVVIHGEVHKESETKPFDIVVAPEPSILESLDRGVQITAVATLTQRNDSGIISLAESGVRSPKDLAGKRLTYWDHPWFHPIMKKAVEDDGGDYSKVCLVHKNVGDIVATIGSEADATWIYKNWEYFEMLHAGKEVNYFAFADYGEPFDFCTPCVAATQELIEKDREGLRAFMQATDEGYIFAAKNPEESGAILMKYMDKPDENLVLASQRYISGLYLDETEHWGYIKPERWNLLADFLIREGIVASRREDEFTNEFSFKG
jgi:ABC-type nitrate/sulfonate/bicarbonate transport system substrate-binding protein